MLASEFMLGRIKTEIRIQCNLAPPWKQICSEQRLRQPKSGWNEPELRNETWQWCQRMHMRAAFTPLQRAEVLGRL
jgi:hypothetical protein